MKQQPQTALTANRAALSAQFQQRSTRSAESTRGNSSPAMAPVLVAGRPAITVREAVQDAMRRTG